jgi:carboxyl-terminal processing protease
MQRHGGTFMWLVLVLLLGIFVGRLPATVAYFRGNSGDEWRSAIDQVANLILNRYVEPVDRETLLAGAIRGMTESLNDPYTEFVPPAERDRFERELTGQFVGIGALVGYRDGLVTIITPLEGSPALAAGLAPGDRLLRINGDSAEGFTSDQAVGKIVGQPGTTVTLHVRRAKPSAAGETEELDVVIRRGPIEARSTSGLYWHVQSQTWHHTLDPDAGIAFVRLDQFTPNAAQDLEAAILLADRQLRLSRGGSGANAGLRGLVLDLRGNPGGLLDQAVAIVELFQQRGPIVSTRGREPQGPAGNAALGVDNQSYESTGNALFPDLPLAILIDEGSASASEIVAGALQDNRRAVVVGTRSFGKGLVQRLEPVPGLPGAQLKLTEQHYYLPSGRLIQRTDDAKEWGVDPAPGFLVRLSDTQRARFARLRGEHELIRPLSAPAPPDDQAELFTLLRAPASDWREPAWVGEKLGDPALARALDGLQHRLRHGAWPEPPADQPPVAQAVGQAEALALERVRDRMLRDLARVERRLDAVAGGSAAAARANRPSSFWDDTLDLTGGRVQVLDKSGKPVRSLKITGPDLERWLLDADVEPEADPAAANSAPAPAGR